MKRSMILILAVIVSFNCKAQTKQDSILIEMQRDNVTLIGFTIEGMKEIRHDALCRLKFKYAHYMNTEIRKEEQILKELTDMLRFKTSWGSS